MSLDVYLTMDRPVAKTIGSGIFVRDNGSTREITRAEWDAKFPDHEPVTAIFEDEEDTSVFSRNITHNLNKMAEAAGIYKHLWRPDELNITKAADLVEPLARGLETLQAAPEAFRELNPENGWGNYEGLVAFVDDYLSACKRYPTATVSVSR